MPGQKYYDIIEAKIIVTGSPGQIVRGFLFSGRWFVGIQRMIFFCEKLSVCQSGLMDQFAKLRFVGSNPTTDSYIQLPRCKMVVNSCM